jgi:DivIVA domain-containing protein
VNQFLIVVAVALTVGLIVFGITVLVTGDDAGLAPVEPDGRSVPLPADRPLTEADLTEIKFDVALRGYRMEQVDVALRRASYDIGYKDELIKVLQAEVDALRDGRLPEAEVLRRAREASLTPAQAVPQDPATTNAEPEATEAAEEAEEAEASEEATPEDDETGLAVTPDAAAGDRRG